MDVPEAVQDAAKESPGVPIAIPDTSQAFEHEGRMVVLPSAIIGFYIVDDFGNVTSFEPNLEYRMVVRGFEPKQWDIPTMM